MEGDSTKKEKGGGGGGRETTYPILRTHIKQPQDLLLHTQPVLVHARRLPLGLALAPVPPDLGVRDLLGPDLVGGLLAHLLAADAGDLDGGLLRDGGFGGDVPGVEGLGGEVQVRGLGCGCSFVFGFVPGRGGFGDFAAEGERSLGTFGGGAVGGAGAARGWHFLMWFFLFLLYVALFVFSNRRIDACVVVCVVGRGVFFCEEWWFDR